MSSTKKVNLPFLFLDKWKMMLDFSKVRSVLEMFYRKRKGQC
ncbi:hypothetical protein HMPREF9953_0229 [Haemophilus parainfluenzae ATCC 33392]|nr:hypothetical protein HMPREF9953_0229 [Haemophilus parainfluenzae ATCC 33392]